MSKDSKPIKKFLIKILISSVLICLLFLKIDVRALINSLELLNWIYAPVIIALIVLNYVISSIRWKYLLIHNNNEKVSLAYLVSLYFTGSFFNNFMPTSIGGDVYKIYKLGKKIGSNSDAFTATFMERFTGLVSLVFISMIGFIGVVVRYNSSVGNDVYKIVSVSVVFLLVFVFSIFIFLKVLNVFRFKSQKILQIYDSLFLYKDRWDVLGIAFISSFIVQFLAIFSQYFIFVALGKSLDIYRTMFIFPIITLATFLIPSLNGIGVQDFLYKFSNTFLFISEPTAIAGSILYHLFRLFVSLIGGILYVFNKD